MAIPCSVVTHAILIVAYVLGALLEILGIVLTVEVLVRDNQDGTRTIKALDGWPRWRGPSHVVTGILIGVTGILVGLGGNVASVFVK